MIPGRFYAVMKTFHFEASHALDGLPSRHKCSRLHGHNYRVELVLRSPEVDRDGFVVDFGDIKATFAPFIEALDHRHLNDVLVIHPTAENIARHLFDCARELWPETLRVRVWETDDSWAEYGER